MAMSQYRTPPPILAGRVCAILLSLSLLPATLTAQLATRPSPSYTSRPTQFGSAIGRGTQRLTISRARGTTNMSTYLSRPHRLLRRNAFSARVQSLGRRTLIQNPLSKPRQADVDQTREDMLNADAENAVGFAELMLGQIAIRRQQAMADGWAYFHDADYLRALSAFESAAMVAPNDPIASFGQLMAVVANRHHRRSLHKLVKLARQDQARPAGVPGMFEFEFSLTDAFVSADALVTVLDGLREFARANSDNPQVQALHCLVLWYTRSNDAMIEARSTAARIQRTHPASPWARINNMIQTAEQHATAERTSS